MASPSRVQVAKCTDEDIPECFAATSDGFGHDCPLIDAYFPNHDTPDGSRIGTARLLAWKQNEPDSTFLKATLGDKIIGVGVWTLMKEVLSTDLTKYEDVEAVWPDEDDREYMLQLWSSYVVPRGNAVKRGGSKGTYVLELLAVRKDYHQRGAGIALVKWGTDAADQLGIDSVVESTSEGRRTYVKAGFEAEIEEMTINVNRKFSNRRKPILIFMRRKYTR